MARRVAVEKSSQNCGVFSKLSTCTFLSGPTGEFKQDLKGLSSQIRYCWIGLDISHFMFKFFYFDLARDPLVTEG